MERNRLTGTSLPTRTLFQLKCNGSLYFAEVQVRTTSCSLIVFLFSFSTTQDGVATKVLAAVAAVVAAAACFRRLRAQLAATTREIGELRSKLAQQQAPPAPSAPVAQAK